MARKNTSEPAPVVASEPSRPPCECGCGGTPQGRKARFLPGHDAKLAAARRRAEAA